MATGLRFEVLAASGNRWMVMAVCRDEAEAVAQARRLLVLGSHEAVKVVREREGLLGLLSSREVFHERAAPRDARRVDVFAPDRMWLNPQAVEELYQPAFRRAVLQSLVVWLDREGMTPTELLHGSAHFKVFRKDDRLVAAFLNQFVQAQIDMPGKPMERIERIERLLTEAQRRAVDFERTRPVTFAAPEDAAAAVKAAAAIVDPERRRFVLTAAITAYLADKRMWLEKADAAMALFARAADDNFRNLIDELLAEAFYMPEMMRQFLGEHRDLGETLLTLADALQGRPTLFGRGAWEKSPKLVGVLKRGQLPATHGALVARLQRILAGRQLLCTGGRAAEAAVVAELRVRLSDGNMKLLGGNAMEQALAARLAERPA